ncbi:NUDIX domain-containing protein [Paenibacillus glycanilyticus]|uniref:NUDIX domain-containing protein n=1 Tax=Paenibacillus glycanilyticus TaxID=126569 RepID=UPI0020413C29|nr:NUDIX domain-containing protein [Paenibacillus glycanilyticus]MCM3627118.1 NUDIX domain-containing protein [Paenibacillus glycanilyticus]
MKPIRNSAKAIIIRDQKILLTVNKDDEGLFYIFPGGGQEAGENLHDAVKRECLEELGEGVTVGDLMYTREYIGRNHEYAEWDSEMHQVEFYFECALMAEQPTFENVTIPDSNQVGIEWIEIDKLDEFRVYPKAIVQPIKSMDRDMRYLGDVN